MKPTGQRPAPYIERPVATIEEFIRDPDGYVLAHLILKTRSISELAIQRQSGCAIHFGDG